MLRKLECNGGPSVKKGTMDLLLSISMAYNVISCRKIAKNTDLRNHQKHPKNYSLNPKLLNFLNSYDI